jgi:hypothetical protein
MRLPHLAPLIVCLRKLPIAEHLDLPPLVAVYSGAIPEVDCSSYQAS